MSEYWKSLPRKFCDMCKCWFADNKASIEFHERGKRHQENVQKRIQEIQKKGLKQFKKQKELEDDMKKIEKAALAAYEKDLKNMNQSSSQESEPSGTVSKNTNESSQNGSKISLPKKSKVKKDKPIKKKPLEEPKKWFEAVTEEGYNYYWNNETSESRWEPPEEGYISIAEQTYEETEKEEKEVIKPIAKPKQIDDESSEDEPSSVIGPQPKYDPYGQWVTVEKKEPELIDYQLPKPSNDFVEVVIPVAKDEPRLKFKEKTIGKLDDVDDQGVVAFKKRKFNFASKKNARQRTTDD